MSSSVTDMYAVVDKSKKTKNRTRPTSQHEVTDVYAVVDKRNKKQLSDEESTKPDDPSSNNSCYNNDDDDDVDENIVPDSTYSVLDRNQAQKLSKEAFKPSDVKPSKELSKKQNLECQKRCTSRSSQVLAIGGIIFLLLGLVAAATALVVVFVLLADIQSDVTVLPLETLNNSESTQSVKLHSLTTTFIASYMSIEEFLYKSEERLDELQNNKSLRLLTLKHNLTIYGNKISQLVVEAEANISKIQRNLMERFGDLKSLLSDHKLFLSELVRNGSEVIYMYIRNGSAAAQNIADKFASQIAQDIQRIHVFDSCTVVPTIPLPFSSGIYNVKYFNGSSVEMYCNISTPLTCDGTTGEWRRIAYVNTINTTSPRCPSELETRDNPPSCRHYNFSAGCSSVTFPVTDNYRCIYGRIVALQSGDPDGFVPPRNRTRNRTINGNYVDGVSLTYGNPREHIWTFAAISIMNTVSCSNCIRYFPSFVESHYTCDVFPRCGNGTTICTDPLWTGEISQCSNSNFYRQLSQPTDNDIEMRVCRDQDRDDEDFLITLVEIYTL